MGSPQENYQIMGHLHIYKGFDMFIKELFFITALAVSVPFPNFSAKTNNFRPYISTNLAKVVSSSNVDPVIIPDNKELCDGSGWITHGDGHKTECPGCEACKPDGDKSASTSKKKEKEDAEYSEEGKFLVYHMGASWCGPCKTMIRNVWNQEDVKKKIEESDAKLFLLDSTKKEDKKYFSKFKIKTYPTLVIVKADDPTNPIAKVSGSKSKKSVLNLLEEKFNG